MGQVLAGTALRLGVGASEVAGPRNAMIMLVERWTVNASWAAAPSYLGVIFLIVSRYSWTGISQLFVSVLNVSNR